MVVQTTYTREHEAAYAGMIADNSVMNSVSKRVDEVNGIGFGLGVIRSTVDDGQSGIRLPVAATAFTPGTQFVGFVIRTLDEVTNQDNTTFIKTRYSSASVLTMGKIWVPCPLGCDAGDQVYVRYTAGNLGTVRSDAGTSDSVLIPRCRFENDVAASANALALISVNIGAGA